MSKSPEEIHRRRLQGAALAFAAAPEERTARDLHAAAVLWVAVKLHLEAGRAGDLGPTLAFVAHALAEGLIKTT